MNGEVYTTSGCGHQSKVNRKLLAGKRFTSHLQMDFPRGSLHMVSNCTPRALQRKVVGQTLMPQHGRQSKVNRKLLAGKQLTSHLQMHFLRGSLHMVSNCAPRALQHKVIGQTLMSKHFGGAMLEKLHRQHGPSHQWKWPRHGPSQAEPRAQGAVTFFKIDLLD
jgi:hypothetical protein